MLIKFGQQEGRGKQVKDDLLISREALSPLAMLLLGEARGEGTRGMKAVGAALRERLERARQRRGKDFPLKRVIFAPNQFEPIQLPSDRQDLLKLREKKPELWNKARQVGKEVFQKGFKYPGLEDYTHFLNPDIMQTRGGLPDWAKYYRRHYTPVPVGQHRFYHPPKGEPMPVAKPKEIPKRWRSGTPVRDQTSDQRSRGYRNYTVQKGDTLSGIGNRFDVDWRNIRGYGEDPDVLKPGQELQVPK